MESEAEKVLQREIGEIQAEERDLDKLKTEWCINCRAERHKSEMIRIPGKRPMCVYCKPKVTKGRKK